MCTICFFIWTFIFLWTNYFVPLIYTSLIIALCFRIQESMVLRHHNEAESLHAVQKMDWEWKMKELMLCEYKASPVIEEDHVPMVHVSDDFDLLPA